MIKFKIQNTIIILFYLLLSEVGFSQDAKRYFSLSAGVGNYEYLHTGISLNYPSTYFEFIAGLKPWGFKNETYYMTAIAAGTRLFKKKNPDYRINQFYISLKTLIWRFENDYNLFSMIGIDPELRFTHVFNDKWKLAMNGGIIYNTLLKYRRKTNTEVGWPKEFQPSFSLQIQYVLK